MLDVFVRDEEISKEAAQLLVEDVCYVRMLLVACRYLIGST